MKPTERASRKYAKLIRYFEERMTSGSDKIKPQAAQRLSEILMHLDTMRDQREERALRRDLAKLRQDVPPRGRRTPEEPAEPAEEPAEPLERQLSPEEKIQATWDDILSGKPRGQQDAGQDAESLTHAKEDESEESAESVPVIRSEGESKKDQLWWEKPGAPEEYQECHLERPIPNVWFGR